jgi:hypothetical protein
VAISQRRNVRVEFIEPNTIQIVRENIGAGGVVVGTTLLRQAELENGMNFMLINGQPDTPDRFGRNGWRSFGPSPTRRFTSEGSFINAQGDALNGTLFMAVSEAEPNTARAITFFGATALLRVWRWDGSQWVE